MANKEVKKKVLLITYYWPPAGGPGVQRWLKFVSYLPQFGIEPIVYIPENPAYPILDKELVQQVPSGVTIIKQPIREPASFAEKLFGKKTKQLQSGILPAERTSFITQTMLYIRANFFIPDARVTWVKPSVTFLKDYCVQNQINTIITTGPPHSLHLIGKQLQREIKVKWLADFRDPWTTIHYFAQLPLRNSALRKHKKLEKNILAAADVIIVTSKPTKTEFEKLTHKPIHVITNGYDEKQLPKEAIPLDAKFSIAHIGSLLSDRNPKQLWKALADLLKTYPSLKNDLQITLAGVVSEEVLMSIAKAGLKEYVQNLGYVSHAEAIRLQHASQILLLLEMDKEETKVILPGKLFEYMAAKRPILAIGPEEGAIEFILKETQAGVYYSYKESTAIYRYLKSQYHTYKTGNIQVQSHGVTAYSRETVSKKMAAILMNL